MSQLNAERKTLEILAEEFVARYRRGERPPLSEYINAHPELSGDIRELFPALVVMEELAPDDSDSCVRPSAAPAKQAPPALGDYRILREVGRGGMGVVYEAEQLSLGRRVALKVLPRQVVADATLRQRFHREARAAAQLHHTNIVPVFEVGEDQDACWYAMQLILGQGLDQIIEELKQQRRHRSVAPPPPETRGTAGPDVSGSPVRPSLSQLTQAFVTGQFALPDLDASSPQPASPSPYPLLASGGEGKSEGGQTPNDAVDATRLSGRSELSSVAAAHGQYYRSVARIGRQAAEALAYAHARGIIHRDIKPSNLLLDTAGVVWIADFGLAKTGDNGLTNTGDIVGTLRYMAPERFKGESDERADVYGLGLTLYELLVLRPAFGDPDRLQLIDRIKNQEPPRPRVLDSHIPRNLETIILKAIEKEPKRRYPTAEAMAEDLRRFLADEPIQARRTSELERLRLWSRRNPAVAMLLAVVAVTLVMGTAIACFFAIRAEQNAAQTLRAERETKEQLWRSMLNEARSTRLTGRRGQRFTALRIIRKAMCVAEEQGKLMDEDRRRFRDEVTACLMLPDVEVAQEWNGVPPNTGNVYFNVGSTRYARQRNVDPFPVSIRNVAGDEETASLPGKGLRLAYSGMSFSADGHYCLARWEDGRAEVYELSASGARLVWGRGGTLGAHFRPDGRQVAVGLADGTTRLCDCATGRELRKLPWGAGFHAGGFHPTLPWLIVQYRGALRIVDVDGGSMVAEVEGSTDATTAAWHPTKPLLAVGSNEMIFRLIDARTGKQIATLRGHGRLGLQGSFAPTGDVLASTDWSGGLRFWAIPSGRLLFHTAAKIFTQPQFSADGGTLAAEIQGEKLQLLNVAPQALRVLCDESGHDSFFAMSVLSPDGSWLIYYRDTDTVLIDTATGERLATLPQGTRPIWIDPKGEHLVTTSDAAIWSWRLRATAAEPGTLRIGPPTRLYAGMVWGGAIGISADGGVAAIPSGWDEGVKIWHWKQWRWVTTEPQHDVRHCTVSPDGHWVVSGSHVTGTVTVSDTSTGRRVKHLATEGGWGKFSPDGRWLAVGLFSGDGRLWDVGAWEVWTDLGGETFTFSPDSRLIAVGGAAGVCRLLECASGREIARLELADPGRIEPRYFTPDGGRLLLIGLDTKVLYSWDLRVTRAELVGWGLDWDWPDLPPAQPRAAPTTVEIDAGKISVPKPFPYDFGPPQSKPTPAEAAEYRQQLEELNQALVKSPDDAEIYYRRALVHEKLGELSAAITVLSEGLKRKPRADDLYAQRGVNRRRLGDLAAATVDLEKALELAPDNLNARIHLALCYLVGPKERRSPAKALRLAQRNYRMKDSRTTRTILALAYCRSDQPDAAIELLERGQRANGGQASAEDWFILALCYQQLGQAEPAQRCYASGARWMKDHGPRLAAYYFALSDALRAEAELALGKK